MPMCAWVKWFNRIFDLVPSVLQRTSTLSTAIPCLKSLLSPFSFCLFTYFFWVSWRKHFQFSTFTRAWILALYPGTESSTDFIVEFVHDNLKQCSFPPSYICFPALRSSVPLKLWNQLKHVLLWYQIALIQIKMFTFSVLPILTQTSI